MNRLYICHTIYHLYIVLLKEIEKNNIVDIILSDSIPEYEKFCNRLIKYKIFNNVYMAKEKKIVLEYKKNIIKGMIKKKKLIDSFNLSLDYKIYDDIYIFNDWTKLGMYFIINKIKYNLIEDGLNSFKYIDKMGYFNYKFKDKILERLNLRILFWGQSNSCLSIEVNDLCEIKIPRKKVKVVSREQLIENLSDISKDFIFKFFIQNNDYQDTIYTDACIVLTQPLVKDGLVIDKQQQIDVYLSIIKNYCNDCQNIIIKPHPRDEVEYSFENCIVIDKIIPIEILNFNRNIKFDKVITIFSTAIDGINFANEKINLGFDYIDKIINYREKSKK